MYGTPTVSRPGMQRPWSARATTSAPKLGASAAASVGTTSAPHARSNDRRRPIRCDRGAQNQTPTASATMSDVIVRPLSAGLTSKARPSSGRIACAEYIVASMAAAPRSKGAMPPRRAEEEVMAPTVRADRCDVQYISGLCLRLSASQQMELRHLRYFVAVAEELHFGRAAARLHIAQPPLSQQILRLEAELGVELLRRNRRSVRLTDAGRLLLEQSRPLLAQADHVEQLLRQASAGEVGRLAVGFVGSASYEALPRILREFRDRHPQVELRLDELTTAGQVAALNAGRIDVGLVRPPV